METNRRLAGLGLAPVRRKSSGGKYKPHLSIGFSAGGETRTFGIDTTRAGRVKDDSQYFLITHAHTDHYGKSAMLSERSLASDMTAVALELRHDQYFQGTTFKVGETIDAEGVKIKTFDTHHSIGSTAFYWENDQGVRILVTGDIKDHKGLPECDVLITEATYGHPTDSSCVFEDDYEAFEAALGERRVAFGAYSLGKAQRAVRLIRQMGCDLPIEMDKSSLLLTKKLLGDEAGDLAPLGRHDGRICITSPWSLGCLPYGIKKYVLTGQRYYEHPCICISDHMDFNGLKKMVFDLDPEITLIYHPEDGNPRQFASFLNKNAKFACTLSDI